jgi:hypothetical protein
VVVVLEVTGPSEGVLVCGFLRPDKRVVVVLADQIDGWGDPPPNQRIELVVTGGKATRHLVDVVSGSITAVVFDA